MKKLRNYLIGFVTVITISACGQGIDDSVRSQYQELSWIDLKPENEREQVVNLDQVSELNYLEFNDHTDSGGYVSLAGMTTSYPSLPSRNYSVNVVAELDDKKIRVPGFIVPVEFEPGNLVTEFFLVPHFGACYHKPPPPPNQTIYVTSAKAIEFESIYDPVWVMGVMKTQQVSNELAMAAYSMDFHVLEPYMEQ